jgi:PleD family two-component response regulator
VSIGVAELTDADTMTFFLAHSDEALYDAKRGGKDSAVLYRR